MAGRNDPLDDSLPQNPCILKCNTGFLSKAPEAIVLVNLNRGVFPQNTFSVNVHYKPLGKTETFELLIIANL